MENIPKVITSIEDISIEYSFKDYNIQGLSVINNEQTEHFLIYEIFNLKDNRYYIGQHHTNNPLDCYMGSGKMLLREEQKYGISSFVKILLADYRDFETMNNMESLLVPLLSCYPVNPMCYNIKQGGSFGQITEYTKNILRKKGLEQWKNTSEEEKIRISEIISMKNSGKNNRMYGRNVWNEKTPEQQREINNKRLQTYYNKSEEEKRRIIEKRLNTIQNKSAEERCKQYDKVREYQRNIPQEKRKQISDWHRNKAKEMWKNKETTNKILEAIHSRAKDPQWLQKMSEVTSGSKNGMYGKHLKDVMSEQKYNEWRRKLSSQITVNDGIKNYRIHRDDLDDYLTRGFKRGRVKRNAKWMTNGENTLLVEENDFEKYLNMCYVFGRKYNIKHGNQQY